MKYLSKESGIEIDDDLRKILEIAVNHEGMQSILARKLGIPEASISRWRGRSSVKLASISWDQWAKVREYLLKENLIDADDPRWMLPSQLRQVALAARERESRLRQLASSFMVDIGAATADIAIPPSSSPVPGKFQPPSEADEILHRAIAQSDVSSSIRTDNNA